MSLSGMMNAGATYVARALVEAGVDEPRRLLRYHGNLPHDCCDEAGFLSVSWADGRATDSGTGSASSKTNDPCAQWPMVTLAFRYVVCWPNPPEDDRGLPYIDDGYDVEVNAKAGLLADVEDAVVRALVRLTCARATPQTDPEAYAFWQHCARSPRFLDAAPILPSGGCAGVQWRLHVAPTPGPVS